MAPTPSVEALAKLREQVGEERLQPAYRLDDATRERYRNVPVMRGVAPTKTEQMYLGEAASDHSEVQARVSSQ